MAVMVWSVSGEFKTVTSFRQEDLPYLVHVLQEAWKRIGEMKQQAWEASRKDTPTVAKETKAENE